jgi:hypothetical protein
MVNCYSKNWWLLIAGRDAAELQSWDDFEITSQTFTFQTSCGCAWQQTNCSWGHLKEIISQACWLCACKCAAGRQHSKSSFNHFEVTSQASWFCACQCTTKQFLNHFEIIYKTSLLCACKWAGGRQQSDSSLNLRCSLTSWQRQWCISFAAIQWSVEAPLRENQGACVWIENVTWLSLKCASTAMLMFRQRECFLIMSQMSFHAPLNCSKFHAQNQFRVIAECYLIVSQNVLQ